MKKINFIIAIGVVLFVCPSMLFAQLKVDSVGNVEIPSKLIIAGTMDFGLKVTRAGFYSSSNDWLLAISSGITNYSSRFNVGISGAAYSSTELNSGRSWGVKGAAGNSTSGYNYGVAGSLRGYQYGAGVFGTTGSEESTYIPGQFAGYFLGNVKVTGNLTANTVTTSDKRLKKNIETLGEKNVLESVLQLNPVVYNIKQQYLTPEKSADTTNQVNMYDENSQLYKKKHFGLLAQELQEIYPDLVYQDAIGYLAIDYTGLIPLLIESIKELKNEINSLNTLSNKSSTLNAATNLSDITDDNSDAKLYQNAPNPFSESTQITFYLPSTIQKAYLNIYDLQGKQIKSYRITQRGSGTQLISGVEFPAGIYLYGLITDGKEIGVKRMILTGK